MKGVKQVKESTGRMKKHRYSTEFKVTAVKMASSVRAIRVRSCFLPTRRIFVMYQITRAKYE